MKLPKKVKILGRTFDIKYFEFEKAVQNTSTCGNIVHYKQSIEIESTAHAEYQGMALLHEIIHNIADSLAIKMEENDVRRLGNGLYQVLNDNGFLKEK
jgi:hypothetical protein